MKKIRSMCSSNNGDYFAFCEFSENIYLFDSINSSHISSIHTIFDFGGNRVAISDDGEYILAAAYHIHGVCLYSKNGAAIWRRKDIKKAQNIQFSKDQKHCIVSTDTNTYWLNLKSGVTEKKNIYINYWEHTTKDVEFSFSGRYKYSIVNKGIRTKNLIKYQLMDVTFYENIIIMSGFGGCLWAYDFQSNDLLWSNEFDDGSHYIRLVCLGNILIGYLYAYSEEKREEFRDAVDVIDLIDGRLIKRIIFESDEIYDLSFILANSHVVTSEGSIYSLTSGDLITKIDFGKIDFGKLNL